MYFVSRTQDIVVVWSLCECVCACERESMRVFCITRTVYCRDVGPVWLFVKSSFVCLCSVFVKLVFDYR